MRAISWDMKVLLFSAIALCLGTGLALPARSATFELVCGTMWSGATLRCRILMSGKITSGDSEKLIKVVANPPAGQAFFSDLILNSGGGDAQEALKLADLVKKTLLNTANYDVASMDFDPSTSRSKPPNGYSCVSACVLVLMGGGTRNVIQNFGGQIGLHRPYFSKDAYIKSGPTTIATNQSQIMQRLREFLRDEGMAVDLIEKMMRHSSREVYWVDSAEWSEKVPDQAPWYEEMLIAQCNYRPGYFNKLFREYLKELETGDKEKAQGIWDRQNNYSKRITNCEFGLKVKVQQEIKQKQQRR